jgi:hypothetical protein
MAGRTPPNMVVEPVTVGSDGREWSFRLRRVDGSIDALRVQFPGDPPPMPALLDGAAFAALPVAMGEGGALRVAGSLSRGALRHLIELAEGWHDWNPGRFRTVDVSADAVVDRPAPPTATAAVCAWSGSLLSTATLVRHVDQLVPGAYRVSRAVHLLGLHPHDDAVDDTRLDQLSAALADCGVSLVLARVAAGPAVPIDDGPGAMPVVAAVLHAVVPAGSIGLHSRAWLLRAQRRYPRPGPEFPDLWSGDACDIRADGGAWSPPAMAAAVARHPALLPWVSDCHRQPRWAAPCRRCDDCVLNALAFVAAGLAPPQPRWRPGVVDIARLALRTAPTVAFAEGIVDDWRDGPALLHRALATRLAATELSTAVGEQARWIGAATGLRPVWPR